MLEVGFLLCQASSARPSTILPELLGVGVEARDCVHVLFHILPQHAAILLCLPCAARESESIPAGRLWQCHFQRSRLTTPIATVEPLAVACRGGAHLRVVRALHQARTKAAAAVGCHP
jgi:hypothetical protein